MTSRLKTSKKVYSRFAVFLFCGQLDISKNRKCLEENGFYEGKLEDWKKKQIFAFHTTHFYTACFVILLPWAYVLNKLTQIDGDRKDTFFAILTVLISSLVYWFPSFSSWTYILHLLIFNSLQGLPEFFFFSLVLINSLSVYSFITYLQPISSDHT